MVINFDYLSRSGILTVLTLKSYLKPFFFSHSNGDNFIYDQVFKNLAVSDCMLTLPTNGQYLVSEEF